MIKIKTKTRTPGIRSEEVNRRAVSRVSLWWLGTGLMAGLGACVYRVLLHHWPSIGWWPGFFLGGALVRIGFAYQEVVALLEHQNALLERLLNREG